MRRAATVESMDQKKKEKEGGGIPHIKAFGSWIPAAVAAAVATITPSVPV